MSWSICPSDKLAVNVPQLRRAFAGEPVVLPAIEYDPNETISGRNRHEEPRRWVSAVAYPLRDEAGVVQEVILIHEDITARRKTDTALRESEERLRRIVNVEGVGVLLWKLPEGRLVDANDYFLQMFGYSRDAVKAKTLTWRDLTPPECFAISEEQLEGFATSGRIGPYEKEYLRKDGTRAWMVFAGAALDKDLVVEYCIDISDRKRAEEAYRQSEERYRTLFNQIDEGFCVIELIFDHGQAVDYRFIEVNPAFGKHTGLTDAVGKTMREFAPDHEIHWFESYGKVLTDGQPLRFLSEAKALGNQWFEVYAFPLGHENKAAVLFSNVTGRVRTEQDRERLVDQLRDTDRKKDDFIALLAHELRNPLAPIRNGLQVLRLAASDRPRLLSIAFLMRDGYARAPSHVPKGPKPGAIVARSDLSLRIPTLRHGVEFFLRKGDWSRPKRRFHRRFQNVFHGRFHHAPSRQCHQSSRHKKTLGIE